MDTLLKQLEKANSARLKAEAEAKEAKAETAKVRIQAAKYRKKIESMEQKAAAAEAESAAEDARRMITRQKRTYLVSIITVLVILARGFFMIQQQLSNTKGAIYVPLLCRTLVIEHEEVLEKWFFKKQTSDPDLFEYLSISDFKKCCATGHFGQDCEHFPIFPDSPLVCSDLENETFKTEMKKTEKQHFAGGNCKHT